MSLKAHFSNEVVLINGILSRPPSGDEMRKQIFPVLKLPLDGELLRLASMLNLIRTIRLLFLGL